MTDGASLCQIMPAQTSKYNSIQKISRKLNLENWKILAFGDDYNDLEMLEKADIGVAMGNAEEQIKAVADFVTLSNEEDVVAVFLSSYIEDSVFSRG